jgi:hypothetical protein
MHVSFLTLDLDGGDRHKRPELQATARYISRNNITCVTARYTPETEDRTDPFLALSGELESTGLKYSSVRECGKERPGASCFALLTQLPVLASTAAVDEEPDRLAADEKDPAGLGVRMAVAPEFCIDCYIVFGATPSLPEFIDSSAAEFTARWIENHRQKRRGRPYAVQEEDRKPTRLICVSILGGGVDAQTGTLLHSNGFVEVSPEKPLGVDRVYLKPGIGPATAVKAAIGGEGAGDSAQSILVSFEV